MRPLLKPALPRIWRDSDRLQLGLDPARAVLLDGVDPTGLRLLALLDGTRDLAALRADAASLGVPAAELTATLGVLTEAGVLDDADLPGPPLPGPEQDRLAPDVAALSLADPTPGGGAARLARRRAARVRVHGACRVGAPLAALLAACGVGRVDVVDEAPARAADAVPGGLGPLDAGRRRDDAVVDLLGRAAPSTLAHAGATPGPAALAVVAGRRARDVALRRSLMSTGTPHLVAVVREVSGVVGPLVLPGRTACLDCCDLHRRDRDPDWPLVAAQLTPGPREVPACDAALAAAVVASAALQALAHLDGAPIAAVGGTLELCPPDHRWRRRSWPPHPDCGCAP